MMEWQPIEMAPREHGFKALLFNGREFPFVGVYNTNDFVSPVWELELSGDMYGLNASPEPTHWMPLPDGPTTKG